MKLTNIQVNCSKLSKRKIDKLIEVTAYNGGRIWQSQQATKVTKHECYFRLDEYDNTFGIYEKNPDYHTIKYWEFLTYFSPSFNKRLKYTTLTFLFITLIFAIWLISNLF